MTTPEFTGCPETLDADLDPGREIKIVPSPNRDLLSDAQLIEYCDYRQEFLRWLLHEGKDPDRAVGYSPYTVYETGYRTARFDRSTWDPYRIPPTPDEADEYLQEIAYSDRSQATKGKIEEALRRYFRWIGDDWDPEWSFQSAGGGTPQDYFLRDERQQLRQAALGYGSIPSYAAMSPDERDRWRSYVSDVQNVTHPRPEHYDLPSWKYASIVWTSLDAGLRPSEVGNATTDWIDTDNAVIRIPRDDASKSDQNWVVSIRERTASILDRWLHERTHRARYDDTNALWLTQRDNPYGSKSLSRLLGRLCGRAGIETETRDLTWYSIRHSVGTYMTREEGLAAAQAQLRHESAQTTMKYDQTPVEDRRNALDRMG